VKQFYFISDVMSEMK